jgi:hypothetical protein
VAWTYIAKCGFIQNNRKKKYRLREPTLLCFSALCSRIHALCSMVHALCSMVHALCSMVHALYGTCSMLYGTCSMLYGSCSMLYGTCSIWYMLYALWYMLYALWYMRKRCEERSTYGCPHFPNWTLCAAVWIKDAFHLKLVS